MAVGLDHMATSGTPRAQGRSLRLLPLELEPLQRSPPPRPRSSCRIQLPDERQFIWTHLPAVGQMLPIGTLRGPQAPNPTFFFSSRPCTRLEKLMAPSPERRLSAQERMSGSRVGDVEFMSMVGCWLWSGAYGLGISEGLATQSQPSRQCGRKRLKGFNCLGFRVWINGFQVFFLLQAKQ